MRSDRSGLRLRLLKQQASAGDIILLFGDESEAVTHPYLARAWAKRGSDLRVEAPPGEETGGHWRPRLCRPQADRQHHRSPGAAAISSIFWAASMRFTGRARGDDKP